MIAQKSLIRMFMKLTARESQSHGYHSYTGILSAEGVSDSAYVGCGVHFHCPCKGILNHLGGKYLGSERMNRQRTAARQLLSSPQSYTRMSFPQMGEWVSQLDWL